MKTEGVCLFIVFLSFIAYCCYSKTNSSDYFTYEYWPQEANNTNSAFKLMLYPKRVEYVQKTKEECGQKHNVCVVSKILVSPTPEKHLACFFSGFRKLNVSSQTLADKPKETEVAWLQFMIDGVYSALSLDVYSLVESELSVVHQYTQDFGRSLFERYPGLLQTSTQVWETASVPAVPSTIDAITANATNFIGMRVSISGFYIQSQEMSSLSSIRPLDAKPYPYDKSVWIGEIADVPEALMISKFLNDTGAQGGWLRLEGIVFTEVYGNKPSTGHLGLWRASLIEITHVEESCDSQKTITSHERNFGTGIEHEEIGRQKLESSDRE